MNLREMKKAITRETASWLTNSVQLSDWSERYGDPDDILVGPADPAQAREGRHAILARRVAKEDFGVEFGELGWSLGMACWIACLSPSSGPAKRRFHRAMLDTANDIRRRENVR